MYLHTEQWQDEEAERALSSLLGGSRPGEAVRCSEGPSASWGLGRHKPLELSKAPCVGWDNLARRGGSGGLVGSSSAKQDQGVCEQQVLRESAASACGCGREGGSAGPAKPMLPLCPAHARLLVGAVFLQGFPE